MKNYKKEILEKVCYTELVYGRINKKLNIELSKDKIEEMISAIISETDEAKFQKSGKNIYITNSERNIRLTINSFTNRIITADILTKITTNEENNESITAATKNWRFNAPQSPSWRRSIKHWFSTSTFVVKIANFL